MLRRLVVVLLGSVAFGWAQGINPADDGSVQWPRSEQPTQIIECLLESVRTQCVRFKRLINIWYGRCEYKWRCAQRGYPLGDDVVYEYQYELWCQLWLCLCYKIRVTPLGEPWLAKSWREYDRYTRCGCTAGEPVPMKREEER